MILDATAGNRTMWNWKNVPDIIYIDIEKKLERKPTLFADNTNTPFLPETFDTIFYDPPHGWGEGSTFYKYPDSKSFKERWQGYGEVPRYYGWDKFKMKTQLIHHIYNAQKEFCRILKDDGLLWFKWNEVKIPLRKVLPVFDRWAVLLFLYIKSPTQTAGTKQTFWICMTKKREKEMQTRLG